MTHRINYLRLAPESALPAVIREHPFRVVVVIEETSTAEWQAAVSDWLVQSGCLYMMAWGKNCSDWDDSVDHANIKAFDFEAIPVDSFVMTTWYDNESLREVFWYCKTCAVHPSIDLERTMLLHIGSVDKGSELFQSFAEA